MSQGPAQVTKAAASGIERAADSFRHSRPQLKLRSFLMAYTIVFALIALIGFASFWREGRSFVFSSDGVSQHLLGLEYFRQYLQDIAHGLFTGHPHLPMYDFSIGMGDNVLTGLASVSYLDVLNVFVVLIPKAGVEAFYVVAVIVRLYLAGLTFAAYARQLNARPWAILVGAVVYVFGGFGTYATTQNPGFGIAMLYAPLLFLGLEKVMRRRSPILLIAATFLTALSGYYFLFALTVVMVLYAVIRLGYLRGWRRPKRLLAGGAHIAAAYFTGVLLAGFMLLPAFKSFLGSAGGAANPITGGAFLPSADTVKQSVVFAFASSTSWEYLSLSGAVLLAACVLFTRKVTVRAKAHMGAFGAALAIIYLLPVGKAVMNRLGFAADSWTFVLAFFGAALLTYLLPKMLEFESWRYVALCGVVAYGYIIAVAIPEPGMSLRTRHITMIGAGAIVVLLAAIVVVQMAHRDGRRRAARAYTALFALLSCASVLVNMVLLTSPLGHHYSAQFLKAGAANGLYADANAPAQAIAASDDGSYRIEDAASGQPNAAMLDGHLGASSRWPTTNGHLIKSLRALELSSMPRPYSVADLDGRSGLESLAGVKYVITDPDSPVLSQQFTRAPGLTTPDDGTMVYRNAGALPLGYVFAGVLTQEAWKHLGPVQRQEALTQAAVVSERHTSAPAASFTLRSRPVQVTPTVTGGSWKKGTWHVSKASSTISLGFDAPAGAETYVRLVGFAKSGSGQGDPVVSADGVRHMVRFYAQSSQYYVKRSGVLVNLGYSATARWHASITVKGKGRYRLSDVEVYTVPVAQARGGADGATCGTLQNPTLSTNKLTADLTATRPGILVVTLPFDQGWRAHLDGKPAATFRANEAFTGLSVPSGTHTLTMTYRAPWLGAGLLTTITGLLALAGVLIWQRRARSWPR